MKIRLFAILIFSSLSIALFCAELFAAKRYALVIGNSNYDGMGVLINPANDAEDMAEKLRAVGFEVMLKQDASRQQMRDATREFSRKLKASGGGVGLFYYAGHGVQVGGENYLIPVRADIKEEYDVPDQSLSANYILRAMERSGSEMNIVILDACRDNPFARSWRSSSRGLARMDAPTGSIIGYATSPGKTASDGGGRNGIYTQHLLEYMDKPGLKIEEVFKKVRAGVRRKTGGRQTPWEENSMIGDFYFIQNLQVNSPPPSAKIGQDDRYWDSIRASNNPSYFQAYIDEFGKKGRYYKLAKLRLNELQQSAPVLPAGEGYAPRMINIPGGSFQMGSRDWEQSRDDDERRHQVKVKSFQLAVNEVTVGEFRRFVRASGYRTEAERDVQEPGCWAYDSKENKWAWRSGRYWDNPGFQQTDRHPVVCVSWNDAQAYIEWLNGKTGRTYRPPTEAEWEYAARAGSQSAYFWSNAVDKSACDYANVGDKHWAQGFPCDDGYIFTAPVGKYKPNSFGLYDIGGNVWEWTCSKYDSGYGGNETLCLSKKHAVGALLSLRGGAFNYEPRRVRSADRGGYWPWKRYDDSGFRLARTN